MLKKEEYRRLYNKGATDTWSRVSHFYGRDAISTFFNSREKDIVRRRVRVKSGDSVLDIACGPGRWVLHYATVGGRVVGLDISPRMIKSAKSKLKMLDGVDFVVGDAEHLPLRDETFDVVSVFDAFPDFPNPFKSILEMRRVANARGIVVVEQSNILSLTGFLMILASGFFSRIRDFFKLSRRYVWFDRWTRLELPVTVENWLEQARFHYEIVGAGILPPLMHKLIRPLLSFEKGIEKFKVFNILGFRLVFLCTKV